MNLSQVINFNKFIKYKADQLHLTDASFVHFMSDSMTRHKLNGQ